MRKIVVLLWLSILLITACSSPQVVQQDGEDVLIGKQFLNKIQGYDSDRMVFFAEDSTWLADGRLNDAVYELQAEDADYIIADQFAGYAFQAFQAEIDDQDFVKKVYWLADINGQPKIVSVRENPRFGWKQNEAEETVIDKPVQYDQIRTRDWAIEVNRIVQPHAKRRNLETRRLLSWDIEYPVTNVIQYPISDQDEPIVMAIGPDQDDLEIDLQRGRHFSLVVIRPTGAGYLSFYDIRLVGAKLVRNKKSSGPDYVLEVPQIPQRRLLSLSEMMKQANVGEAETKTVKTEPKKRYTKRQKYPDGWYYVETKLLYDEDKGFFTLLSNYRHIVTKTEDGQKVIKNDYVLVGANYLKKWSDVYEKYKDKNRFVSRPYSLANYPKAD